MKTTRRHALVVALVIVAAISTAGCDWRGAAPTEASVTAELGGFAVETATVPAGAGFAGGTVYYPTGVAAGPVGAVAVVPGFLMNQSTMSWYGARIASQGFVVFVIDTLSPYDQPASRATQLLAALDHLVSEASPVDERIDPERLAVMGWSMGGGGAMEAAKQRPSLKAAVALAPWQSSLTGYGSITVPTQVVACQSDAIAPVASHATPIYEALDPELPRAFLEIAGADHFCVTTGADAADRTAIARQAISWLKRWVDGDTRFDPFLCPAPPVGATISRSLSSCPY